MAETVIPILPCPSIDEILDFYRALGFEVTSHQKNPNPYCGVRLRGIELQFFGMKSYDPSSSYSTCYVLTDDVDELHASFRAGLKAALGKVPTRGLPRIGALKDMSYGVRQFLMTDPGGNCIRIGRPIADSFEYTAVPKERYARALHQATLIGESKGDHAVAARIIDRALDGGTAGTGDGGTAGTGADAGPSPLQLVLLLVLRADMAAQLDGLRAAAPWLDRADAVELGDADRQAARDALRRAADLRAGED
ncbi:bleomycin resistance protein [Streptomyces sp. CB02923]|uniref:bleomycin resistance protein n=1 Tax=Streptomyces sp. CB02923 TaxID=1718985 RepID=UPI0009397E42|nr:VOC family protein [Streptomyces sp. CB02923]OKI07295.1 bleomycin resistance protein [Streptomyces sp. CB02923]